MKFFFMSMAIFISFNCHADDIFETWDNITNEQLKAINTAVDHYKETQVNPAKELFYKEGRLKLRILFDSKDDNKTCITVISGISSVRGGYGVYCIENETGKILEHHIER